jgi:hypothetical protein
MIRCTTGSTLLSAENSHAIVSQRACPAAGSRRVILFAEVQQDRPGLEDVELAVANAGNLVERLAREVFRRAVGARR